MEYKEQIHYSELPSRNIYVDAVVNSLPGYYPARSEFNVEPRNDIEENLTNVCLLYAELLNEEDDDDDGDETIMENENSNSVRDESIVSNKSVDLIKYDVQKQQKHDERDTVLFTNEQNTRNKRKSTSKCSFNNKKRKTMQHLENSTNSHVDMTLKSIPINIKEHIEQVEILEHRHSKEEYSIPFVNEQALSSTRKKTLKSNLNIKRKEMSKSQEKLINTDLESSSDKRWFQGNVYNELQRKGNEVNEIRRKTKVENVNELLKNISNRRTKVSFDRNDQTSISLHNKYSSGKLDTLKISLEKGKLKNNTSRNFETDFNNIKNEESFYSIDSSSNQTHNPKCSYSSNVTKVSRRESRDKIKTSFNMVKTDLDNTGDTGQSVFQNKEIKIENPDLKYERSFDSMNNIEDYSDNEGFNRFLNSNEIKLKTDDIPFAPTNVSNSVFDLEENDSQIKISKIENIQISDSHNCCLDCKYCQLNRKHKIITKKDKQILLDLCLTTIEIYNNQLRERNRRKEFVKNHGFLDQKKVYAWYNIHNLELGEPFNVLFKKYIRLFKNSIEFDKFIQSLKLEKQLKLKISQLDELRKNGIRYMKLIPIYNELNKQRNERLTELSKINVDDIVVKKEDRTIDLCELVEQKKPRSKKLIISHLPMYKFLSEPEKELCEDNRLTPESFLQFKQIMVEECEKLGSLKLAQARVLFKIDVNKTRKIYNYLLQKKLIWK